MKTKIFLVDDHQVVRDGLRLIIQSQADMEVAGEAANGRDALTECVNSRPDIVIMDIHMEDTNGLEVSRQIISQLPGARIIILSAYPDPDLVKEAVQIGVAAYLLKSNASTEILKAIRTVLSGKNYLCMDAANVLMMNYKQLIQEQAPREKAELSDRELDVLKLIAEGLRTKEIADRLNIGIKTVETHRAHLMSKLGCKSPVELAKYALREGIAPL